MISIIGEQITFWFELSISLLIVGLLIATVLRAIRPIRIDAWPLAILAICAGLPYLWSPPTEMGYIAIAIFNRFPEFLFSTVTCFSVHPELIDYKPMLISSAAVVYHIFGPNYHGYHAAGLFQFVCTALLVAGFTQRLFRNRRIYFWSAVLFIIHPAARFPLLEISSKSLGIIFGLIALCNYLDRLNKNEKRYSFIWFGVIPLVLSSLLYEPFCFVAAVFPLAAMAIKRLGPIRALIHSAPYWGTIAVFSAIPLIRMYKWGVLGDELSLDFGIVGRTWDYWTSLIMPSVKPLVIPEVFNLNNHFKLEETLPRFFTSTLAAESATHWVFRAVAITILLLLIFYAEKQPRIGFLLSSTLILLLGFSLLEDQRPWLLRYPVVFIIPVIVAWTIGQLRKRPPWLGAMALLLLLFFTLFSEIQMQRIGMSARGEGIGHLVRMIRNSEDNPDLEAVTELEMEIIKIEADRLLPITETLIFYDWEYPEELDAAHRQRELER